MSKVVELIPLKVGCTWPVYRGVTDDGAEVFVKTCERALIDRTNSFLTAAGDCDLLPKPVEVEVPQLAGRDFMALTWISAQRVDAEAMTDAQADSLLAGSMRLLALLERATNVQPPVDEDSPEYQYRLVANYAGRHRFAGKLLKSLLAIPPDERSYSGRRLVTIHGDLQPKNYGFDGERLAAIFDFDEITRGIACEDIAYAFTERARKAELGVAQRERLVRIFRHMIAASPWPFDDWRFAVSHCRLRIAARRLESHPDSPWIAVDIARRDRPLAEFAKQIFGDEKQ